LHGENAAALAESDFDVRFRKREQPTEMREYEVKADTLVTTVLHHLGWAPTRRKAYEQVRDRSVRANGEVVSDNYHVQDGDILQVGQKRIGRIKVVR
jgi:tyrosyl-tRNA synthetase